MGILDNVGQPWLAILVTAAIATALVALIKLPGVVWAHVLVPISKTVLEAQTVSDLSSVAPELIKLSKMSGTLEEIWKQFKTDSGSSLRDLLNRMEVMSKETQAAVELLQRQAAAPGVIQVAKVEAEDVKAVAAEAATEILAMAAAAAARLMAVAEKKVVK